MNKKFSLKSKRIVESLPGPQTDQEKKRGYVIHWDSNLRGYGLRITNGGVRSFILQTRIKGREKRITVGRFSDSFTPEKARKKAEGLIGEIATGGDPVARTEREKLQNVTLEKAFQDYVAERDLKESTADDMIEALNSYFSKWKKQPIAKITRDKVKKHYLTCLKRSESGANLAFRYLRAVFNLAIASYTDSEDAPILVGNPVKILSDARLWRKQKRRDTTLNPEELKTWIPALLRLGDIPERDPGKGKELPKLRNGEVMRDLLMFLVLTGCRKGEAFNLLKEDVDLKGRALIFRDTKNRQDHRLPMTDYLFNLVSRRMEPTRSKYVFASPHDDKPVRNLRYAITRLESETGKRITPHDLRRLAATTMERVGVPIYTIKAILNHLTKASDVTGGYVQVQDDMKLSALEKIENYILQYTDHTGNVINIRKAG